MTLLFVCSFAPTEGVAPSRIGYVEKERNSDAVAGFSYDIPTISGDGGYTTEDNVAISRKGAAVSGERLFVGYVDDSDVDRTSNADGNVAVSNQNVAVAGR